MALPPGEEPRQVEAKDKGNMEWIVKIIKLKKRKYNLMISHINADMIQIFRL